MVLTLTSFDQLKTMLTRKAASKDPQFLIAAGLVALFIVVAVIVLVVFLQAHPKQPTLDELIAGYEREQAVQANRTSGEVSDPNQPSSSGITSQSSASSASAASSALPTNVRDGVYTGRAIGFAGEMVVDIEIRGGLLVNIQIASSGDQDPYRAAVSQTLPDAMVRAQSPEISGVSGATITSAALRQAVRDAIAQSER